MSETWLPWIVKRPGPEWKQGYSGFPSRRLDQILGEVKHSAGGGFQSAMGELDKKLRQASWTFTVAQSGAVHQHYPLESITWHCGKRGNFSDPGNVSLVGMEHEGGGPDNESEPLTLEQLKSTSRLTAELRALCPNFKAQPPTLRVNLWEHNWLSSTACPSSRIPWTQVINAVNIREIPVSSPSNSSVELYKFPNRPEVYELILRHITSPEEAAARFGPNWPSLIKPMPIELSNRTVIYPDGVPVELQS